MFSPVDWHSIFVPDTPLLEIFVRGSLVYLAIFILLRAFIRRQAGSLTLSDFLLIVLIADAAQNAMGDDYKSIPDGILLVATLIFWDAILDWLAYRFPTFGRYFHKPPLPIIRHGEPVRANLKKEMISHEELMSRIRLEG